jgi:hypothetical protein
MSKRKRKSKVVELAQKRVAGLDSISPTLDMGNGLTIANYHAAIEAVIERLETYNSALSIADAALDNVEKDEKILRELSERMLEAVGAGYGHNSNEYAKAGGVRKEERKRRRLKIKTKGA